MDILLSYDWPGNIRELENLIQRSMIVSSSEELEIGNELSPKSAKTNSLSLQHVEKNHIIKVLEMSNWKVNGKKCAAEKLQINPKTLFSRMEKLNITSH